MQRVELWSLKSCTTYYYCTIVAKLSLLALAIIQLGTLCLKLGLLEQPSYHLLAIDLLSSIEMCLCRRVLIASNRLT